MSNCASRPGSVTNSETRVATSSRKACGISNLRHRRGRSEIGGVGDEGSDGCPFWQLLLFRANRSSMLIGTGGL